ncbi:hypothetical protein DESC_180031 [Desulfosarcina cetonica]|nr:hypothetical protein DESC_180031 [Desulfosarcina cetonica]
MAERLLFDPCADGADLEPGTRRLRPGKPRPCGGGTGSGEYRGKRRTHRRLCPNQSPAGGCPG